METRSIWRGAFLAIGVVAIAFAVSSIRMTGQSSAHDARMPDGKPNLNGIWQAMNSANWNLQAHAAGKGPVVALGAAFSIPAGQGVVEGNEIPYLPAAMTKKRENAANWLTRDPAVSYTHLTLPTIYSV